jgi:hypothetical protein
MLKLAWYCKWNSAPAKNYEMWKLRMKSEFRQVAPFHTEKKYGIGQIQYNLQMKHITLWSQVIRLLLTFKNAFKSGLNV